MSQGQKDAALYSEYVRRAFLGDVNTVHDDVVGSIIVEALSELSKVAETFYESALRQAIDALGAENVIDGVVVEAYKHTPAAQRLKAATEMRNALEYAGIPDVGELYRAFVVVSGIVNEAVDMVVNGNASDVDLALFRRRMRDSIVDSLKAALVGALDAESLARSIVAFTAIRVAYEGAIILIDDVCLGIRSRTGEDEQ